MNNTYRIKIDGESGYVRVNGERFSINDAADIFWFRMLNTMNAMKEGKVSKAVEITIREVRP